MRFALFLLALLLSPAAAQAQPASAQASYVERRGLLEADAHCSLFSPDMRGALEAGAAQARGVLLRSGWTTTRIGELERAATAAAAARTCADPRTAAAAETARAGFSSWARASSMTFPGAERAWVARRIPDATRWRLSQSIDAPRQAIFGVREDEAGRQHLVLVLPLEAAAGAPASAQLILRDRARANASALDLRGRLAIGLAANAPSPATAARFFANARYVEQLGQGRAEIAFAFPDAAFQALLTLDPRETMAIDLETGGRTQRLFVEIGDIAAARAFLVIGAES